MVKRAPERLRATPLNLRLSEDLAKRIDKVQDLYVTTMNPHGFSAGPVKGVSRAEIVRWAIEQGLDVIEAGLMKRGGRK